MYRYCAIITLRVYATSNWKKEPASRSGAAYILKLLFGGNKK